MAADIDVVTAPIPRESHNETLTSSSERGDFVREESSSLLESKSDVLGMDWTSMLSPTERSCIDLTVIEPCVNKAIANLESLKKTLAIQVTCGILQQDKQLQDEQSLDSPQERTVRMKSKDSDLSVEGFQTGIMRYRPASVAIKSALLNGTAVLSSVLNIVARLEQDRQAAQNVLDQQVTKTSDLKEDLEREDERRLDLLLKCVQAEHERCAKEIRDTKWDVFFSSRRLNRRLYTESILTKKNNELKKKVSRFTEINPQLKEKIELEKAKMRDLARMKKETEDDQSAVEKDLEDLEEKCHHVHLVAEAEEKKTEERKGEVSGVLKTAIRELNDVCTESEDLLRKIKLADGKLISSKKKAKELERQIARSGILKEAVKMRVEKLEEERGRVVRERDQLEKSVQEEIDNNAAERLMVESRHSAQLSDLDREQRDLVMAKRAKEDLEHDIDTIKETIFKTKQKIVACENSISRAYREIERLDKQLEISLLEYNHAFRTHRHAKEEYKVEKIKCDSAEELLNKTVDTLKHKIKEQSKLRILYENKTKAQNSTLLKLLSEYEKKEERIDDLAMRAEERAKEKTALVNRLEAVHNEKMSVLEQLKADLDNVKEELSSMESELGTKKDGLTLLQQELKEEMLEKVNGVETISDKIKDLEAKAEDKSKTIAGVFKLQDAAKSAISELEEELRVLEERLAAEEELVQSWRDEYKEIADFTTDANGKHSEYLKERKKLLQQTKSEFAKVLGLNDELASGYHQLQCNFIDAKMQALKVIEKKLKMESSLRDHQQLIAFQSSLYSSLQDYYSSRQVQSRGALNLFRRESKWNLKQLGTVRGQLENILSLLVGFMEQEHLQD